MSRVWILIMTVCLLPGPTFAHIKTARHLKSHCDAVQKNSRSDSQCNSYIHGVYDAIDGIMACPPASVTHQAKVEVVRAYMKSHSERLDEHEANLVVDALKQAYPCRDGKP